MPAEVADETTTPEPGGTATLLPLAPPRHITQERLIQGTGSVVVLVGLFFATLAAACAGQFGAHVPHADPNLHCDIYYTRAFVAPLTVAACISIVVGVQVCRLRPSGRVALTLGAAAWLGFCALTGGAWVAVASLPLGLPIWLGHADEIFSGAYRAQVTAARTSGTHAWRWLVLALFLASLVGGGYWWGANEAQPCEKGTNLPAEEPEREVLHDG